MDRAEVVIIAGPTGVGKSEAAVELAEQINGEIISADSVQVYKRFTIGSGKPSAELLKRIPHHLVGCIEPDQPFNMWDFKAAAEELITEIIGRGKQPIIAGGTGLYIKALLKNFSGGAAVEAELRKSLEKKIKTEGTPELYEWLIRLDPSRASKLHPNDTHRIIRGLENVLIKPEKPPEAENGNAKYRVVLFALSGSRQLLYEQINQRVENMLKSGWIEETENIIKAGYSMDSKPFLSVGYRQIVEMLSNKRAEGTLLEEIQTQTRRYAKRQITWINPIKGAIWMDNISAEKNRYLNVKFMAENYKGLIR